MKTDFYAETDYGFRPYTVQAETDQEAVDIAQERYGNSLIVVYEEVKPMQMRVLYERR